MSATTEAKRVPTHHPGGGVRRPKPYGWLFIGGLVFVAAWLVWTFFFSAQVPP